MPEKYTRESDYSHLYNVPMEALELSEAALQSIRQTGITSVGDCLDYFLRAHEAMITASHGFIKTMETEVKAKLRKHGYLTSDWDWDEAVKVYRWFADTRPDLIDLEHGKGMLALIDVLRHDPDIQDVYPRIAMFTLILALADYDIQSVHAHWVGDGIYNIFFTPVGDEAPDPTTMTLNEASEKVKEYLNELRARKKGSNRK